MRAVSRVIAVVLLASISAIAAAQSPPPVRPIGPLLAASTEPLSSISQVRALSNGHVLVNDILARRVLMFDSTFQHVTVIVDTTSQVGGLIAYRGDTSLSVNPALVSMLVIDPDGKIVRTMAIPDPRGMLGFLGGPSGTPGLDAQSRLVYAVMPFRPTREPAAGARSLGDSAPIIRFNLESRTRDTVTKFAVPPAHYAVRTIRFGKETSSMTWRALDPTPTTDDWAILSDGTIAVVHGREYRVDMIDVNGRVSAGPKLPFEWQRLSEDDKSAIIDSTAHANAEREAQALAARASKDPIGVTVAYPIVTADEMPDYRPAFEQGAARGDADGKLWIRTSKFFNGGAVYDVINKNGELVDRVAVPQGRVIAGFGPGGVVYMGVLVGTSARIERARVR
jgi:hypothetical protein